MAGFGIQKRGTSKILLKRKGFEEGGIAGETEDGIKVVTDSPPKKLPSEVSRNMTPLKPDKSAPISKMPNEDLSKEKSPEDTLQFRCAGPNQNKKCGHRDSKKKGGYVDMSEEHEGMESKAEEAREYAMEEKGYKETKSGKMVKKKTKKKKK